MLMIVATFGAFGMIWSDNTWGRDIVSDFPMLEMSPPAARSILSSILGAMVSTTGVVFSITIVALSLASSQFGSRLIRTYRNRKTTHFTLGIFVSTSLFAILVLTSIREVGDYSFVPTLSVITGILLTVLCLATLVYYIHDMSQAIQAPNVIQQSADDLDNAIDRLFPESIGHQSGDDSLNRQREESALKLVEEKLSNPKVLMHEKNVGYIQAIENETVMGVAEDEELTIRLLVRPGDFLYSGRKIAEVYFDNEYSGDDWDHFQKRICKKIQSSLILGSNRTHLQDIRYAFSELVDIAVRALSPGINDPFTAVNCVDRIHATLIMLKQRDELSPYRMNEDGVLRVIANPVVLSECIEGSLGVIKDYSEGNPMVELRLAEAFASLED